MQTTKINILVIAAELIDITLAYYLDKASIAYKLIKARNRIDYRIYTV